MLDRGWLLVSWDYITRPDGKKETISMEEKSDRKDMCQEIEGLSF